MSGKILEGRKLEHDVEEKNMGHFFFDAATKHGEKTCQIDATIDKSETFASVKQRSVRVAIALQQRGIKPKDVVAFCSPNTLDVFIPIISTFYLGGQVANLEPSLSALHTTHLIKIASPKIIFVEEASVPLIEGSVKESGLQVEIIVLGHSGNYTTFAELAKPQPNEEDFRPADVDAHEVAVMLFSSGTTGLPKAICHSSYTFLYVCNQTYQDGLREALLHFTTVYWMTAMIMLIISFKSGSYRVFCRDASPERVFKIIEQYKIKNIFMAPNLTYPLTKFENAKNFDLSSVCLIKIGGTPMALSQLKKMRDLFQDSTVNMIYGMTEAGIVASFNLELDRELSRRKGVSSGKVAPGVTLKVVDPDTNELLGPHQKGEIRLKVKSMMKGYRGADSSDAYDESGFLKTGDIGYYDEDECIYVVERIKEMFKYQSWHIVPSAIEAILLEHPAVKEAVVFGIPREEEGEAPAACIILKNGYDVGEQNIHEFLEPKIVDRERLRGGITFVKSLPKTPTGKVVRRQVKDLVLNSLI